jgi:hypothetical protein
VGRAFCGWEGGGATEGNGLTFGCFAFLGFFDLVYLQAEGFFLHAFLSDQLAHALRWIEFLDHPVFAQAALQSSFFLLCLSNASCHLCIPFD